MPSSRATLVRVQRPGAAVSEHGEVARVEALGGGYCAHRIGHLSVGDAQNAERGGVDVHPERLGDLAGNSATRSFEIELHLSAEEVVRIEPSDDHVGVRHRRLGAAASVAHRPGLGARTLRADPRAAVRIEPCEAAPAGADLIDVKHSNAHRQAGVVAADEVVRRGAGETALDHTRLGGGAAHVEGYSVVDAEFVAEHLGAGDTRCRPRFHHLHR